MGEAARWVRPAPGEGWHEGPRVPDRVGELPLRRLWTRRWRGRPGRRVPLDLGPGLHSPPAVLGVASPGHEEPGRGVLVRDGMPREGAPGNHRRPDDVGRRPELARSDRVDVDLGKRDPADFALWKFAKPDNQSTSQQVNLTC